MDFKKELGEMLLSISTKLVEEEMKKESDTELKSLYEQAKDLQSKFEKYASSLEPSKETFQKLMNLDITITNIHQSLNEKISASRKSIMNDFVEEVVKEGDEDGE